jgi:hypothetical protein
MNALELRDYLLSPQPDATEAFRAVQSLCALTHNHDDNSPIIQELLLYMMDKEELFKPYKSIINSLLRKCGLFPYLEQDSLSFSDAVVHELHKFEKEDLKIVFHRQQFQIYSAISEGKENIILSAPTSFGKSLIIEAIVAGREHNNIAVILPTIALVDELRRCLNKYTPYYKLITHNSQSANERNIFLFTQERFFESSNLPKIDFFILDEFYKLNPVAADEDNARCYTLNKVFYRLLKEAKRFYLLGPNIEGIDFKLPDNINHTFYKTDFKTVAANVMYFPPLKKKGKDEGKIPRLIRLSKELTASTLIYCYAPYNATAVALALKDAIEVQDSFIEFSDWLSDNYHPEWVLVKSIRKGIGLHHGKLPRAITQYCIKKFNAENEGMRYLVCTSTIIEGVNTKAKNIVLYDNTIGGNKKIDYFTFNNICGRSGRMLKHYVGNIYLFHPAPQQDLPIVSPPILSQSDNSPASLLIELDSEDVSASSKSKLDAYINNKYLPLYILKKNSKFDLERQVALAKRISENPDSVSFLSWSGVPSRADFLETCRLLFHYGFLAASSTAGFDSPEALCNLLWQFRASGSITQFIKSRVGSATVEKTINKSIDMCLYFTRNTMSYKLPNALNALDLIQTHSFGVGFLPVGSYTFFSGLIENFFQDPIYSILDEYGLPMEIGLKLQDVIIPYESVDQVIQKLSTYDASSSPLSDFEKSWFVEIQKEL